MSTDQHEHLPAHVIVIGNEKGGSGKSTLAIHLAVALIGEGFRVATLDLDSRQQTLTNYIRNRRKWSQAQNTFLPTPEHQLLEQGEHDSSRTNKWSDCEAFSRVLTSFEKRADFIIIDTPSYHTPLSAMAHAAADTLVTPMNDSMLDIDVLARLAPETGAILGPSIYSETVQSARDERTSADASSTDWIVLRNRIVKTQDTTGIVGATLDKLAERFGFRLAGNLSEHTVFRDYFDKGLTALDPVQSFGTVSRPTVDHMASRTEILGLLEALNLPLDTRVRRRMQAQMIWRQSASLPLELTEILA